MNGSRASQERAKMIETVKPKQTPHDLIGRGSAESRVDPLTGGWTIFAPYRDGRPEEFVDHSEAVSKHLDCPFCPGNEMKTPTPVWVARTSDDDSSTDVLENKSADKSVDHSTDDWSVRVVPNKYPAVDAINIDRHFDSDSQFFQREPIRGGHEVIIESRQHVHSITELDLAEVLLVFQAYQNRLRYWRSVPGIAYLSTFKNVGGFAGASLRHTHSQLIATDKMPPTVASSILRMDRHRASTGCCLQCDLVRAELKAKQRVVWHDDTVVAFCPFASRLPMLISVTTLEHQACFEDLCAKAIESVSRLVVRVVSWLEKIRPGTSYNYCLYTRPPATDNKPDSFHWSIEIFPRMTRVAGFEWSSQCMINPVLPEVAAAKYRSCAVAEDPRVAF
jgi:UDPglucose--hexose-1-phosphate uridylyltransferase